MRVTVASQEYDFPSAELTELRDSNDILNDAAALRERIEDDGYLLIRGLHDRDVVLEAGDVLLGQLAEQGALAPGTDLRQARINPDGKPGGFHGGRKGISHDPRVLAVLEGKPVFEFFQRFFSEPARTFDYKWIRAVGTDQFTGAHLDVVYMGRGSTRLHTVWAPMCDVPMERGPLALCVGSHRLPGFEKLRQTYGKMDVDRDHVLGWYSDQPREITERFGGQWATTSFQAGDVLIFGMYMLHTSIRNTTGTFRISSDTRFQPAADPVDERWVGANPIAHYGWNTPGKNVSMAEARAKWGV